jgi:hypothetical protein
MVLEQLKDSQEIKVDEGLDENSIPAKLKSMIDKAEKTKYEVIDLIEAEPCAKKLLRRNIFIKVLFIFFF